jgi:hypothetical protein
MRRFLFLFLVFAVPTFAQRTVVLGTVTDSNSLPYSQASLTVTLSLPTGSLGAYLNGAQIAGTVGPVRLDNNGSFLVQLADNTLIQCANAQGQIVACVPQTQWTFAVNISPGIAPPAGTGPQSCSATLTISGASQSVSSSFSACPVLTKGGLNSTNAPGPVFNVKGFGAAANSASDQCTGTSTNLNCSTASSFTSANVGNRVSCNGNGGGTFVPATTTFIVFVNSHNMTMSAAGNGTGDCLWGTPDDTAATAAFTAAKAQMQAIVSANTPVPITIAPTLYFPSGQYNFLNTDFNLAVSLSGPPSGFTFKGDGADVTKLSWNAGTTNADGCLICATSSMNNVRVEGLTMDGVNQQFSLSNAALFLGGNQTWIRDVIVQRFTLTIGVLLQGGVFVNRLVSVKNGEGLLCLSCNGEIYESVFSNNGGLTNGTGIVIQNVTGVNNGAGLRIINGLLDENSPTGAGVCDIAAINAADVWLVGVPIFSTAVVNGCGVGVDANSYVHMEGGLISGFGTEFPRSGATIAASGLLQASDVRFISTGSAAKCINNSGTFNDNGGNTCESLFPILSGTSVGTTATLTLSTAGGNVNATCAVGDALLVTNPSPAGYGGYYPAVVGGGITAVTASTLSYTTTGSNLGNAGASGLAFCRNLLTYTGNLPHALLNNPVPNTCYITGTFAATTTSAPMCNFRAQTATNISFIKASSTTVTACTVAPVVTITDGTVSVTLTLTTAKSQWDSSVDASSGVNATVFRPNGGTQTPPAIVVTNTAGTCTTSPTNFAVSYNVAPILSN